MWDPGLEEMIILKMVLKKNVWCIQLTWDRLQWRLFCEKIYEAPDSIRGVEFLKEVSDYKLLKNNCAPWN
jgi:hypothetical protein